MKTALNRLHLLHFGVAGRLWLNAPVFKLSPSMTLLRKSIIFVTIALLAACKSEPTDEEFDIFETEREFYESAHSSLRSSNFQDAIAKLQRMEARFPFGRYAEQAQLELIFGYYRAQQPESARVAADRFIRLHPQHINVDYAYYLRAMASYDEDRSFLNDLLPIDPSKRDPGSARSAFNDFAQLIQRYPDSKYAPDAQQRMVHLRNLLARYEIHVGRYYIERGAYVAAANRGRYVFENFQRTPSVADGLAIMIEAYKLLGMSDLADESLQVLTLNHPDHPQLGANGEFRFRRAASKSLLNLMTFGLFG